MSFFHSCFHVVEESNNWLWLINVNNCFAESISLTTGTNYRAKIGNKVSKFMYSNWITQSYYSHPKHKSLIPKYLSMGWQLSQKALVHSIWVTQPPLSKSELELMWQVMLFLILSICHMHWTEPNCFELATANQMRCWCNSQMLM